MELLEFKKYYTDLEGVQFCIRALNIKESRIHVSHLLVSRGFMYGTDGRRLHRYKMSNSVKPGIYRVLVKLKNHVILVKTKNKMSVYPKITHIINKKSKHVFHGSCHKDGYMAVVSSVVRAIPEDKSINPEFLIDINEYGCEVQIHKDMLSIEAESKKAIIMFLKN